MLGLSALLLSCGGQSGGPGQPPGDGGGGGGGGAAPKAVFPDLGNPGGTNGTQGSIALAPGGRVHLLYTGFTRNSQGVYPIRYGECGGDCTNEANWRFLTLDDHGLFGGYGRMVRDARGGLHAVWLRDTDANRIGPERLVYAYCGGGCTQGAGWQLEVFPEEDLEPELPALAASPEGEPAIVYALSNYASYARYYLFRQGGNWARRKLAEDASWSDFALAMGPDRGAQLAFRRTDGQGQDLLTYLRCSGYTCEQTSQVDLAPVAYRGSFSLALSSAGAPRLGFYFGRRGDDNPDERAYFYLACDQNCTSRQSWQAVRFPPPPQSRELVGIGLALDARDRPRMVVADDFEVRLLSCEGNCARDGASWRAALVETGDQITPPPPPPGGCRNNPQAFWYPGYGASLSVSETAAHLVYDVRSLQGCNGTYVGDGPRLIRYAKQPIP